MHMPTMHSPTNVTISFGLMTRESMVRLGMDSVVTLIMKASTVPRPVPL